MATIYHEKDIERGLLEGKTVAVAGYGEQGRAHALNLRDSGFTVIVAETAGTPDARLAEEHGFTVHTFAAAAAKADVVAFFASADVLPELAENKLLILPAGFDILYGQIEPPDNIDVVLLSPKAPGALVRSEYERGSGVPGVVAVYRDFSGNAMRLALAYGLGIGCARAGIIESTFKEETESSLFAEQAVVCGGVPELLRAAFDTLTENGCDPEVAYIETLHRLRLAAELFARGGMAHLNASVADMTEYGGHTRGGRVVGNASRDAMRDILEEIRNGSFAREWLCESLVKTPVLKQMRERARSHPIEAAGKKLRKGM